MVLLLTVTALGSTLAGRVMLVELAAAVSSKTTTLVETKGWSPEPLDQLA